MKIAVYTIAKNEEQFVARWAESCKEADYRIILDTGSTDNTVSKALDEGVLAHTQTFNPWRFDVARNASLALVPEDADLCIALDMDEVLLPGWREQLEKAFTDGVTRPRYQYTWSWVSEGVPGLVYGGDKIHHRHGYSWKHPVHEVLVPAGIEIQGWYNLQIHHHPDQSKSRGQYLPLLELSVREDPDDDRNAHYYARELFFNGQLELAGQEFRRHLDLPRAVWAPERAASMRYLAKIEPDRAEEWLTKACAEAPGYREAFVELAKHYYERSEWEQCLRAASKALAIVEKPLTYLNESFAWGDLPWDLAAVANYQLGHPDQSMKFGLQAVNLNPLDERLRNNLGFYQEAALAKTWSL
jgi:tetratricopeptide (TPR) repeat protein